MSKSKTAREQTQALRRRGQTVPKKTLDNGDRFIDGLKLANALGVICSLRTPSPLSNLRSVHTTGQPFLLMYELSRIQKRHGLSIHSAA
jgi:hypothetical protein